MKTFNVLNIPSDHDASGLCEAAVVVVVPPAKQKHLRMYLEEYDQLSLLSIKGSHLGAFCP